MSTFNINNEITMVGNPRRPKVLAHDHKSKIRPLCLCKPGGVEMYIAHISDQFMIKRMPNSDTPHHHDCDAFGVPPELPGPGQFHGRAISVDKDSKLNRWSHKMAGKRSWRAIRKYLLEAAHQKQVKTSPLFDTLLIPKRVSQEEKKMMTLKHIPEIAFFLDESTFKRNDKELAAVQAKRRFYSLNKDINNESSVFELPPRATYQ